MEGDHICGSFFTKGIAFSMGVMLICRKVAAWLLCLWMPLPIFPRLRNKVYQFLAARSFPVMSEGALEYNELISVI